MRFSVIGTQSGTNAHIELIVDAKNADQAEYQATQRGITVSRVRLAGPEAATSTAEEPALAVEPIANHSPATTQPAISRTVEAPSPAARMEPIAAHSTAPVAAPAARRAASNVLPVQTSQPSLRPAAAIEPSSAERVRKLGVVAFGLGGAGLVFCWIPVIGLISAPMCLVGMAAGGLGAWQIWNEPGRKRVDVAKCSLPAGGAVLSALALCVAVFFAFGSGDRAEASGLNPARLVINEDPAPAEAPKRNLTIVASPVDAMGGSLFTPSKAASQTNRAAGPAEPPAPMRLGDAEIAFVEGRVDYIQLIGDMGRPHGNSDVRMLTIKVAVRNAAGAGGIEYRTLAGDSNDLDARAATLADDRGIRYRRGQFEVGIAPAGRVPAENIAPGRGLTDTLVFAEPPMDCREFVLTLDGRSVGTTGRVEMVIPAGLIRR